VRDKYYISHLATAPWAAGHGVGGQMLQWIVDKGRKEGKDVALLTMTERHVRFIFGFRFGSGWDESMS
jgi:predicted GNAT family acetyltransferase